MGYRLRRIISAGTFVRLAISILLALVIWGFIVWETNPEITREYQNIAITAENIPTNMLIVGGLPSATVTLKGPQDVVEDIVPSDVTASIDFSEAEGPGIDEYDVEVDAPSGVREVIVEPTTVEVELDLIVTRTFQLSLVEAETRPASVTSVEASVEVASIEGPLELVEQVEKVELPVDLEDQSESFSEDVPLTPVAADGSPVEGVTVSPPAAEVTVTFESTSRDVPVVVKCACIVDDRLQEIELTTAAAIPSTVRLSGPSSALASVDGIETVPIDISGLNQSGWILDVELSEVGLPQAVGLSNRTVDVWVYVAPSRLEIPDVEIQVVGLSPDLEVDLTQETALVVVTGDEDLLDDPEALSVMAVVDVTGLSTGSYSIDVRVVVPPGVAYEAVTPETVRVVLSPRSTTANRLQDDPGGMPGGVR